MATVGKIQVEIEANNAKLAAGLKVAEAQVKTSTAKMNNAANAAVGAGIAGGSSFKGVRGMLGGFGAIATIALLSRVMEEVAESSKRMADGLRNSRDWMESTVAVLEGIPFFGGAIGLVKNIGLNASGAIGDILGIKALSGNLNATSEAGEANALANTLRESMFAARDQFNVLRAPNETARIQAEFHRDMAAADRELTMMRNALKVLRVQQGIGGLTQDDENILNEARRMMEGSLNIQRKKKLEELQEKQSAGWRPDVLQTALGAFSIMPALAKEQPVFDQMVEELKDAREAMQDTARGIGTMIGQLRELNGMAMA